MHRFLILVACWLFLLSNAEARLTREHSMPLLPAQGEAVGFYCLGARHLDPASGRWTSPDPLGHTASLSLYDYADGDPINRLDPDGRVGKAVGNFAYNGMGVGQGLGAISSGLDSLSNYGVNSGNSLLAMSAGGGSSLFSSLSAMTTARTYVEGTTGFAGNIGTVYNNSRTTGSGVFGATTLAGGYALTSWNVGAILEGANNVNMVTGDALGGWVERGTRISGGVAGTAAVASLGLGTFNALTGPTAGIPPGYVGGPGAMWEGELLAGRSGRFADLKKLAVTGDDLSPHHMPQAAQGFTSYAEGGALMMPQAEHLLTRTYGTAGRIVAQQEAGMSFRQVLARDIRDVRSIVGSEYNGGLQNLLNYYRQNFPELMAKPK